MRAGDGTPARAAARHSSTSAHSDRGSAHTGLHARDNRGNTGRDIRDNRGNTARDVRDNRGNTGRDARDAHSVTNPGTVDRDLHPALTANPDRMLGSSQLNRRCGEMTQTKFK